MTYSNLALNLELGQEILVGKNNEKARITAMLWGAASGFMGPIFVMSPIAVQADILGHVQQVLALFDSSHQTASRRLRHPCRPDASRYLVFLNYPR